MSQTQHRSTSCLSDKRPHHRLRATSPQHRCRQVPQLIIHIAFETVTDRCIAPTPLPPPSANLTLTQVAIGRGTQNYTCANSTAQAVPVQVGAMASLFNATCLAAPYPQLLTVIPGIAVKYPVPTSSDTSSVANVFLSGYHFFVDATTPFFDLDTSMHQWGTAACKKNNSSPAPDASADVPWLKLVAKSSNGCTIQEVYRLNTVGGQPPATCDGQNATINVPYAAEYWFWATPS